MDVGVMMVLWILLLSGNVFPTSGSASIPPVIYGYEDPTKTLVRNWGFELDFDPNKGDWFTQDAMYSFENDAHTGSRSVRLYNRTGDQLAGLVQDFGRGKMKPRTAYYVSLFFKIRSNPPGTMFGTIHIMVESRNTNGDKIEKHDIARIDVLIADASWHQIGGDYITPDEVDHGRLFIEAIPKNFECMIDTVSVIELPHNKDWKNQTDIDIEKHRKNMLTLHMNVPKQLKAFCKVKVELTQKKRHFAFGSSINGRYFNPEDEFAKRYRNFFFNTFESGVLEKYMTWAETESRQNNINLDKVLTAVKHTSTKNVTLMGHAIFWHKANPLWVNTSAADKLEDGMNRRINEFNTQLRNMMPDWEVFNEYLHDQFYSRQMNDALLIDRFHGKIHQLNPDLRLFLNDFECLSNGRYMSGIVYLAERLRIRDAPIHGIGLQSHMRTVPVFPEVIQKRLQIATNFMLPVKLTELSIHTANVTLRAEMLELILRMAFSNPGVESVTLWGFSDTKEIGFEPEQNITALFMGEHFRPNEAGRVLLNLLKKWRTSKTFQLKSYYLREHISAFHGLYEAKVYYKDKMISNVTFYLHPGKDLRVNIPLTAEDVESVDDGDTDNCGAWVPEFKTVQNTPRPRSNFLDSLEKWRKKTKVHLQPYLKGTVILEK